MNFPLLVLFCMVVVTSFPKAAQETSTSRSWVCSNSNQTPNPRGQSTVMAATLRAVLSPLSLLKLPFPSPECLQNTERVLLDKAELEAEVERLKEQGEFLRTFCKEVRGFPRAPAVIPIS